MIQPCLTYVAPAWTPACDTAWERLEMLDSRAVRAGLYEQRDSDILSLLKRARYPTLQSIMHHIGADFLQRHARRENVHLLGVFTTDIRQRHDLPRQNEALERILAWIDSPPDRQLIISFVRQRSEPLPRGGSGRASRDDR